MLFPQPSILPYKPRQNACAGFIRRGRVLFSDGCVCATQGEISRVFFSRNSKFFQLLDFCYSNSRVLLHSNNILPKIKSKKQ